MNKALNTTIKAKFFKLTFFLCILCAFNLFIAINAYTYTEKNNNTYIELVLDISSLSNSKNISPTDGVFNDNEIRLSQGNLKQVSIEGNTLVIETENIPDKSHLDITLNNIKSLNKTASYQKQLSISESSVVI